MDEIYKIEWEYEGVRFKKKFYESEHEYRKWWRKHTRIYGSISNLYILRGYKYITDRWILQDTLRENELL